MSGRRLLQVDFRDRRPVGFGREADERGELSARDVKGSFSSCLGSCSGACRPGVAKSWRARLLATSSVQPRDETPEGRSVVVLAKERYGLRARQPGELCSEGAGDEYLPSLRRSWPPIRAAGLLDSSVSQPQMFSPSTWTSITDTRTEPDRLCPADHNGTEISGSERG
jgi:hypothetical protein